MKKGHKFDYKYCTLTKIQARSQNLESGPLPIEIGTSTPSVKLQILAEDKKIPKVMTVRVCPYSEATDDLLRENMALSLGCKIKKNIYNYTIT